MIDERVEHVGEILRAALVGRELDATDDLFHGVVVKGGEEPHRLHVIGRLVAEIGIQVDRGEAPAGENFRDLGDGGLIVSRDRLAGGIELQRAVGLEEIQPEGEELHDFARIIFVGQRDGDAAGVEGGLGVAERAEINTHHRAERDRFEEVAEIAEGSAHEVIVVVGEAEGIVVERALHIGDDEDFAEGKGDALAELVGSAERKFPPRGLTILIGIGRCVGVEDGVVVEIGVGRREVKRRGQSDLRIDPRAEIGLAFAGERIDLGLRRAEGGLDQKPGGLRGGERRIGEHGRRGRRREEEAGAVLDERALEFSGGVAGGLDAEENAPVLDGLHNVGGGERARGGELPEDVADLTVGQAEQLDAYFARIAEAEVGDSLR